MSLLNRFKAWSGINIGAATQLAVIPAPKVPRSQQAFPSFLKTASPGEARLPVRDLRLATSDIASLRNGQTTRVVIRDFAQANSDLSSAVFAYLRTAITPSFTAVARNMDSSINPDATNLLQQLLVRFDTVRDYTDGFSGISSMRSNSETLAKEIILYGSCSAELVLGKDRLPRAIVPVSTTQIVFQADTAAGAFIRKPQQRIPGGFVDLDVPTFFYVSLDQDLLDPYSQSPLESAIQPAQFSIEFLNDLRRVIQKALHPRLVVTIGEESFKKNVPAAFQQSQEQYQAYMNSILETIRTDVNGLNPEDALVLFDTLKAEYMTGGNTSLDREYSALTEIINSKIATGSKTMPSILGHGSGSQNVASTETMLFVKNAEGAVQEKLNEIYSQMLTLALRLFGLDVYVEFKYERIDLRPDSELEAFKSMKQSRMLELLSLGLMTDEEVSLQLTGNLPPQGYVPRSGTDFYKAAPAPAGNPASNTSALNQNLNSTAPAAPKGASK